MRSFALSFVLFACASRVSSTSAPASGPEASRAEPSGTVTAPGAAPEAPRGEGASTQKGDEILARPELSAYHGWIRYLQFRAAHAKARFPNAPEAPREDEQKLAEWAERITSNPNVLGELRGVVEWAYLSPVDDSGQPFKLNIPTDYDPAKPAPVSLYMHGYSGNHLEHALGMQDHPGSFEVSVLGRSRGGRYRALSEADVLHVLDYVITHWKVDLDRVHLNGGSMGGGGTFWLGSRYPQRFASGRPVCGYASDKPLGNLLTFPIYATHSDDDWTVPVLHSRGPIAKLRALGGNVTLDEATGFGHAVWNYAAGNARGEAWYVKQVRPPSREVERLDFTALDGNAVRAFWAEVSEWGPAPTPAHFALQAKAKNRLEARLENITRLTLRLSEAPIDPQLPLRVAVDGAAALRLPAPLPSSIVLARGQGGWAFEARAPEALVRLHTPGGANQLYNGEPLLIVYGTRGDASVDSALKQAADVASRSSNASWPAPNGGLGADGIAHNQNLYGELDTKADVEVTAEDVTRRHLVLIGTADQNSVVERMASKLPVRYGNAKIEFNDGEELDARDRALGLVHYNPEAPSRLVFWVASNELAAYAANSLVVETLGASATGADAAVVRVSEPTLVLTRSFDSHWRWLGRDRSALLPSTTRKRPELALAIADAVRRGASADYALAFLPGPEQADVYESGTTRLADLEAQFYYEPISVMRLSAAELTHAARALPSSARLEPAPDLEHLNAKREYSLALGAQQITPFVGVTHLAPRKYQVTDTTVSEALVRFGVRP